MVSLHIHLRTDSTTGASVPADASTTSADDDADDVLAWLQTRTSRSRRVLKLADLVPPRQVVKVDCQRVMFLRSQFSMSPHIHPETSVDAVWWHDSTWSYLRSMPCWSGEAVVGFSLYTDGTAHRDRLMDFDGVVLQQLFALVNPTLPVLKLLHWCSQDCGSTN